MIVNVWDWRLNLKYASNKVSAKIKAIAFSDNGNFVTIGNRHVKFWYLQSSRSVTVSYNFNNNVIICNIIFFFISIILV